MSSVHTARTRPCAPRFWTLPSGSGMTRGDAGGQHLLAEVRGRYLHADVVVTGLVAPGTGGVVPGPRARLGAAAGQLLDRGGDLLDELHRGADRGPQAQGDVRDLLAHGRLHHPREVGGEAGRVGDDVGGAEHGGGDACDFFHFPVGAHAPGVTGESPGAGVERRLEVFRRLVLVAAVGEQDAVPDGDVRRGQQPVGQPEPGADGGAAARAQFAQRLLGLLPGGGVGDREPAAARVDLLGDVRAADHREVHAVAQGVDRGGRRVAGVAHLGRRVVHRTRAVDHHRHGRGRTLARRVQVGRGDRAPDRAAAGRGDRHDGVDLTAALGQVLVLVDVHRELRHVRFREIGHAGSHPPLRPHGGGVSGCRRGPPPATRETTPRPVPVPVPARWLSGRSCPLRRGRERQEGHFTLSWPPPSRA